MAARNPFASSDFLDDPYGLVQSRRPVRHSTGYYFIRNLLLVGAVAGGIVAAYRNDVFRDLARHAGLEQRYLDAEKFLVGTPGWGTPRSMEPVLNPAEPAPDAHALATTTDTATAAVTATAVATEAPTALTAAPAAAPAHAASPEPSLPAQTSLALAGRSKGSPAAPVAFDSLPVLNRGAAPRPAAAEPAPHHAAVAAAPVAHAAPAPVAHATASRPAPVDHSHAKAIKVSLDEDAPAEPPARHAAPTHAAPPPEPAPVAAKPQKPEKPQLKATEAHDGDNPLLAAVRGAVRSRPPKGE